MARVLGAIIGGGRSRRFGSDKAAAQVDGKALIEHVHAALLRQCDAVIVCGRQWRQWPSLPDLPAPDLGPLGGVNAALDHARANGFAWVLCAPVDTLPLPDDLLALLAPGPACLEDQRLIGLWPTALADRLAAHIAGGHRSVRSWIEASDARTIGDHGIAFANFNTPQELDRLRGNMS